jgi:hypothetical protein
MGCINYTGLIFKLSTKICKKQQFNLPGVFCFLAVNQTACKTRLVFSNSKFQDNGRIFWRRRAKKPGYPGFRDAPFPPRLRRSGNASRPSYPLRIRCKQEPACTGANLRLEPWGGTKEALIYATGHSDFSPQSALL